MSIITTTAAFGANLGVDLTKNATVAWHQGLDMVPFEARNVFKERMVPNKTSEHSSIDFSPLARKTGESSNYAIVAPTQGDTLNLTQAKFTASVELSKEILMYDKYNQAQAFAKMSGLGRACPTRMEQDLQLFLMSYGFGSSYTDIDGNSIATTSADGLSIFHSAHTVNGSSSTYSNTHSTAFGQTGLETGENKVLGFLDHQGNAYGAFIQFDTIITTRNSTVVNLVKEYNKGMNHIEDQNRGINAYQGRYNHIVFSWGNLGVSATTGNATYDSTKDNYWLLASLANNHNLILEISQSPQLYGEQLVQRTRDMLFQTDAHYAYGCLDPKCVVGSNAS